MLVILLTATQDIAVDGWAITLLKDEDVHLASSCQTVGLNTGYFLSFTVFLAFNSAPFCNKYLRALPSPDPLLDLPGVCYGTAMAFALSTALLLLIKEEVPHLLLLSSIVGLMASLENHPI